MPDFPKTIITGVTRQLVSAVTSAQSPFTLGRQIQDWGGEIWRFQIDVVLRGKDSRSFEAFANATLNKRKIFTLRDALICNPSRTEAITVDGGGQSGNELVTSGWGAAGIAAGDFFSIGVGDQARLYQITEDCIPVAGSCTLRFVPRLRLMPSDGEAVEIAYPQVAMRATEDVPTNISVGVMRFTVNAAEAI
ncbi:hypothetical protein [Thioclava sp. F36-6]|uniref:hypothetical protein n=1 Tax=Thioclava sp. F36-6 TaxID=1915316 RepID=UPI000998506C|nr:hypothetical protein [Thioclava sp. F36-6]OOY31582.1 hypothetical protein BMI88_10900 [Thioclava sp. F36-6]